MKTIYGKIKFLIFLALSAMVFTSCSSDDPVSTTAGYTFEADYLALSFTNTSKHANSYEWDFGDGNTSTEENPTHTYTEPGDYTVILKAMGEDVDPVTANINVQEYIDPAEIRKIVFITDDDNDHDQINWLRSNPYFEVTEEYYSSLSSVSQEDIDMLNASDLIIIGRSGSSGDFDGEDKTAWNSLTTPIILNSQWAARDNRLNWFANAGNPNAYNPEEAQVVRAQIQKPDDEVFEGLTIDDNLLPWLTTPVNLLYVDKATNGEVLAAGTPGDAENEEGGAMLFVRFDAGVEFYEGAGDAPAGSRTYFGFGADEGGTSYYWQLTDEAKRVYLNEINRIVESVE